MLAKTYSATVIGIDAYVVELEVNVTGKSGGGGAADSVVRPTRLPHRAQKISPAKAFCSSNAFFTLAAGWRSQRAAACSPFRWILRG